MLIKEDLDHAVRHVEHDIMATVQFVDTPGRILFHLRERIVEIRLYIAVSADIRLLRNAVTGARQHDGLERNANRLRRRLQIDPRAVGFIDAVIFSRNRRP